MFSSYTRELTWRGETTQAISRLLLSPGLLTCMAPQTHLSEHDQKTNGALPTNILGDCCALANSLGMTQSKLCDAILHYYLMVRPWIGYALASVTDTMI